MPAFPYSYAGRTVTLAEQLSLDTFKRLHPEVQRRFVGLQLFLFVTYGVQLGVGTGWRVQPVGAANHAAPGQSYHEGCPVSSKQNALAIDTVGLPTHEAAWTAMEKHLAQFGFTSFTQPQIKANWAQAEGRAYAGDWDRPHIQPTEVRYTRSKQAAARGVTSPNLGTAALPKWPIDPRLDLDLINVNAPLDPHSPVPPTPVKDDMNTPASVLLSPSRLDNFIRGDDGHLYHNWWDSSTGWSAWEDLGGMLASSPSVTSLGMGRIDVTARGMDNALWHIFWDGTRWSSWERIATSPWAA